MACPVTDRPEDIGLDSQTMLDELMTLATLMARQFIKQVGEK